MKKLLLAIIGLSLCAGNLNAITWRQAREKEEDKRQKAPEQPMDVYKGRPQKPTTTPTRKPTKKAYPIMLANLDKSETYKNLRTKKTNEEIVFLVISELKSYKKNVSSPDGFLATIGEVDRAMKKKFGPFATSMLYWRRLKNREMKISLYKFAKEAWLQTEKIINGTFMTDITPKKRKEIFTRLEEFFQNVNNRSYEPKHRNYKDREKEIKDWIKQIKKARAAA